MQYADTQVPCQKTVLAFLGMTEAHFIYGEGMNMWPDAMQQGFAETEPGLASVFA